MKKINFITVCTDHYPTVYAKKIIKKFSEVTKLDFEPFCITDRPKELENFCTPIEPEFKSKGWWNKVNMLSKKMPAGWCLYIDIDCVIIEKFDKEILWVISQDANMSCVSDPIKWMNEKFNSSFMIFKSGKFHNIYEKFKVEYSNLENREGGDQVWLGPQIKNINYIDKKYPYLKQSLKFGVGSLIGDRLVLPKEITNKDIKIIDCAGKPKPPELIDMPYIKKNWHDIEVD